MFYQHLRAENTFTRPKCLFCETKWGQKTKKNPCGIKLKVTAHPLNIYSRISIAAFYVHHPDKVLAHFPEVKDHPAPNSQRE